MESSNTRQTRPSSVALLPSLSLPMNPEMAKGPCHASTYVCHRAKQAQESLAQLLLFVDDDAEPCEGCLVAYADAFRAHPRVGASAVRLIMLDALPFLQAPHMPHLPLRTHM